MCVRKGCPRRTNHDLPGFRRREFERVMATKRAMFGGYADLPESRGAVLPRKYQSIDSTRSVCPAQDFSTCGARSSIGSRNRDYNLHANGWCEVENDAGYSVSACVQV